MRRKNSKINYIISARINHLCVLSSSTRRKVNYIKFNRSKNEEESVLRTNRYDHSEHKEMIGSSYNERTWSNPMKNF